MKKQIVIIGGLWMLLVLGHLFMKDQVFSPIENRYLEQRPKWIAKEILDGSFAEKTESWLLDQLPGRDNWVQLRTILSRSLGRTENQGVYFGKNQYLLESFQEYDQETLHRNLENVGKFLNKMEETGIKSRMILVPTAAEILKEKVPEFAPEIDQGTLLTEIKKEIPQMIEVDQTLREHADEEIYYRTDHHWTSLGAYYAYEAFREITGRNAQPIDAFTKEVLSEDFYGTSFARAGLYSIRPDVIIGMYPVLGEITVDYGNGESENSLYDRSFLQKRDQYRVFLKGNYPITTIQTGIKNGEKLLLVKDSYANTFVQFLVSDYEEIQMIDLRYFHMSLEDYAKEQGFTEVLVLYQIKNFAENRIAL